MDGRTDKRTNGRTDGNLHAYVFLLKQVRQKHPKLSQICSYGIFSNGLKNEFETAVVNEPSVFEPLKFYCIKKAYKITFRQLIPTTKVCMLILYIHVKGTYEGDRKIHSRLLKLSPKLLSYVFHFFFFFRTSICFGSFHIPSVNHDVNLMLRNHSRVVSSEPSFTSANK